MKWTLSLALFFSASYSQAFISSIDQAGRDKLKWNNTELADTISDYTMIATIASPIVYAVAKEQYAHAAAASGVIAANHFITSGLKSLTKRMRPSGENNRAFPSGHTSDSFTAAGLLCVLSKDPLLCTSGFAVAGAVGYLRIAADKHWLTDVVAGAALGVVNGQVIPSLVFKW